MLAVCQVTPSACAALETDMDSRPRARSPQSTAWWVRRALGSASRFVSCLHTRRQEVQAKRRTRTTSSVGLQPTGTWARRRTTVPRATPCAPHTLHKGSARPKERTIAHIKSWKILYTAYRRLLETFELTITAALALYSFKTTP